VAHCPPLAALKLKKMWWCWQGGGEVLSFVTRSPRPTIVDSRLSGLIVSAPLIQQAKNVRANVWIVRAGHLLGKILPSLQFHVGVPSEDVSRDPEVREKYISDPLCPPIGTVRTRQSAHFFYADPFHATQYKG
jgi:alpha-beta hydrolase superfamily lysophospholipase